MAQVPFPLSFPGATAEDDLALNLAECKSPLNENSCQDKES
jgi:hypothetical protein